MKVRDGRTTKCTNGQDEALVLDWVQNTEEMRGTSTVNMNTVIQFRSDKDKIKKSKFLSASQVVWDK